MKQLILLLLIIIFNDSLIHSQANFIIADTVCINQIINVQNTSIGGNTFSWNHCTPDVGSPAVSSALGNPGGQVSGNPFCDIAFDGTNYYMFITNYSSNSIVRWDFGNSPLNIPTSTNLGNISGVLPNQLEGIQIVKEGTDWYGLVVGNAKLIRINFGNSLSNIPTATDLGNPSNLMSWPHEYQIVKDGNNWFGVSANRNNSRIVIHDFGTTLTNTPTASSHTVTSQNQSSNIMVIKENGNWHIFTSCLFGPGLVRLDYGNSLNNIPSEVDLGDLNGAIRGLPRGLIIIKDCDKYVGFIGHENGDIIKLEFQSNLTSPITTSNIGNISNAYQQVANFAPMTFNGNLYLFSSSWSLNDVVRMGINMCIGTKPPSDSLLPTSFSYSNPGTYHLSLIMNQGRANQSTMCKTIEVVNSQPISIGNDTSFCSNITSSYLLDAGSGYLSYNWNNTSFNQDTLITTSGNYDITVSDSLGCIKKDTINITFNPPPTVNLGNDTSICENTPLNIDAGNGFVSYLWNDNSLSQTITANQNGLFYVNVEDTNGCIGSDTIIISYIPYPIINFPNDTVIPCNNSLVLNKNGNTSNNYIWQDNSTNVSYTVTKNGYYSLVASNQGCLSQGSINVLFDCSDIFIPNTITTDNDNTNNIFLAKSHMNPEFFELRVFNRWGQLIYFSNDINKGWDGTFNGAKSPIGTYNYIVNYKFPTDLNRKQKIGYLNIIK